MKSSYPSPDSWVKPRRFYWMCCCDCGLIHKLEFRVRKHRVEFRGDRDNRATGQYRRFHKELRKK